MEPHRLENISAELAANTSELRVSKSTNAKALASSIMRVFEDGRRVEISCIGVAALSQAVKAVAIAMGETGPQGYLLAIVPAFDTKMVKDRDSGEDHELTSMKLKVFKLPISV